MKPAKPPSRPESAGLWQRISLFRRDMFRSQPERLYRAWMAQMRVPFRPSVLVNDPALVEEVLRKQPEAFPKASLIGRALSPLLGRSVFVTNGDIWARQRRIIDPAFEGGRLGTFFPAMIAAVEEAVARWPEGEQDAEPLCSQLAADIIFRTLFSRPITAREAQQVFDAFQAYQRSQPVFSPIDLLGLPFWWPRRRPGRILAAAIRTPLTQLVDMRLAEISSGTAPDDLATRLLTALDPRTGHGFSRDEMIDQVAIFFLAGHETSASALAWALYLLANSPDEQTRLRAECEAPLCQPKDFAQFPTLRNVIRETLRLYPPVPMMVRQTTRKEHWRGRSIARGALVLLSPWYLHRHERLWDQPDAFRPGRWTETPDHKHFIPFSVGPRICPGAGFAMLEIALALHRILQHFDIAKGQEPPVPVAHLTVRAERGINLSFQRRL